MKASPLLAAVLSSLLFAGCFELLEEIWINPDGSGRIRIDFSISEAMFSMGEDKSGEDPLKDLDKEFEKAKQLVEKNLKVKRVDFQQYSDGKLKHFVLDIEVGDFTELNDIPRLVYAEDDTPNGGGDVTTLETSELRIERQSGGRILFSRKFGRPTEGMTADSIANEAQKMSEAMAGGMFGDYSYAVRLHASNIASSNGEVDGPKSMVEWKMPIGVVMAGKSFNKELRAEIAPPAGEMLMYIVACVLLAGVVAALIIATRRKKTPSMPQ